MLEEKEVDLEVDSSAALVALELVAQRLLCWLVCDVSLAQMTKLIPWLKAPRENMPDKLINHGTFGDRNW